VDGILDFDAPFLRPSLSPSREKSRSLDARTVLGLGRASSRVLPFFFFCVVGKDNKICRWRFSFGSVIKNYVTKESIRLREFVSFGIGFRV